MTRTEPVTIDVTRLIGRLRDDRLPTGIDRVSLAYVAHYRRGARALVRHGRLSGLFSEGVSDRLFDLLLQWPLGRRARLNGLLCQGVASCIGHGDARRRFMFHTGHSGLEDASTPRMVRWHRVRPVFVVHDLIPIRYPAFCRPGEPERHTARLVHMLQLGTGLIANSQSTLQDLHVFAQAQALALPPTVVAPLAPASTVVTHLGRAEESVPARPYFVALGTIEPRKNHTLLLDAWEQLVKHDGEAAPQLVIVGQRGWKSDPVEERLSTDGPLCRHVRALRTCTDADLAKLLHRARALVFPSLAEGFGLPVVEALAAGVPVIASNLPVLREVAQGVPDVLDPRDLAAWVERIRDYTREGSAARAAQLQRLAGFAPVTWSHHFEIVDEFLARLDHRR